MVVNGKKFYSIIFLFVFEDLAKVLAFVVPIKGVLNFISSGNDGTFKFYLAATPSIFELALSVVLSLALFLLAMMSRLSAIRLLKTPIADDKSANRSLPLSYSQSAFFMKSALVVAVIPILLGIFFHKSFLIVCILLLLPLPIAEVIKNYDLKGYSIYYAMQAFTWFALMFVCGVLIYATLIGGIDLLLLFVVLLAIRQFANNARVYFFYFLKWRGVDPSLKGELQVRTVFED